MTAIVRNAAKIAVPEAEVVERDILDLRTEDLQSFDTVVNAFGTLPDRSYLHFLREFYEGASNQAKNLEQLRRYSGVNWTFVSPAAIFDPKGKRTRTYQKGKDHMIHNSKGESYVSYADFFDCHCG
ncbi:Putative NADH-flavin reductase [Paenibacillus algorifonticola]|uniref:Putative NADH-flavin reductase n=1 Tax=Paenibacillus algorifonticola TaxID=684063 RepID=A0A1I2HU41_9BACL|nr:Putative NADH-flavin reductase [Paenibacillus algorifonticola]